MTRVERTNYGKVCKGARQIDRSSCGRGRDVKARRFSRYFCRGTCHIRFLVSRVRRIREAGARPHRSGGNDAPVSPRRRWHGQAVTGRRHVRTRHRRPRCTSGIVRLSPAGLHIHGTDNHDERVDSVSSSPGFYRHHRTSTVGRWRFHRRRGYVLNGRALTRRTWQRERKRASPTRTGAFRRYPAVVGAYKMRRDRQADPATAVRP